MAASGAPADEEAPPRRQSLGSSAKGLLAGFFTPPVPDSPPKAARRGPPANPICEDKGGPSPQPPTAPHGGGDGEEGANSSDKVTRPKPKRVTLRAVAKVSKASASVQAAQHARGATRRRKLRARLKLSNCYDVGGASSKVASVEVRRRILMMAKQSYWNQFQQGMISRTAAQYLRCRADDAIESGCNLDEWSHIEKDLRSTGLLTNRHAPVGGLKAWQKGGAAVGLKNLAHADRKSVYGGTRKSLRRFVSGKSVAPAPQTDWKQLSRSEKLERHFESVGWTVLVVVAASLAITLTLVTGAQPARILFDSEASRGASVADWVTVGVRAAVCLCFSLECIVRCAIKEGFVKVTPRPPHQRSS